MAKMAVPVIPVLVAMMLVTGVCNTLLSKYQDMQCVGNCDAKDPRLRQNFEQPVIQTAQMFIGEAGCWLVVAIFGWYERWNAKRHGREGYAAVGGDDDEAADDIDRPDADEDNEQLGNSIASLRSVTSTNAPPAIKALVPNADDRTPLTGRRIFLLSLPTICDIIGTTLMNIGLLLVAASIYQMTRGALVLFVGLLSVIFLSRRLLNSQWAALFMVVMGVFLVGLSGAVYSHKEGVGASSPSPDALRTVVGVLIIAGAQIFTATQFVLEEWILEHYALEPIKVVAWEGTFGFGITIVGMVILHLAIGRTAAGQGGYFDAVTGIQQVFSDRIVGITSVAIMISIGAFNFFGLSVTRSVSATARSTIDTCRTLGIWFVSLILGWETFKWLQVAGFIFLVAGTGWFNGLWGMPCWPKSDEAEQEAESGSRGRGGMGVGLEEGPVEHV